MKTKGIIRKADELGRIVIPKEMRKRCRIEVGDPVEFRTEGGQIIISRAAHICVFCGNDKATERLLGQLVCSACKIKARTEV